MKTTVYTKPVERITKDSSEAQDIIDRCGSKMSVFNEMFKSMNEHDEYEFSDPIGFCMGMETICTEIIDKLDDAGSYVRQIKEDIKLCSLDPEKVQQQEEYLCSIGIDVVKVTQEA